MKTLISNLFLAALLILPVCASASGFTGIPKAVRIQQSATLTRISILVGPHGTTCPSNTDWYAYETTSINKEDLWAKGLLDAVNRRNVTIQGSGLCDAFGIEKISFIDFK